VLKKTGSFLRFRALRNFLFAGFCVLGVLVVLYSQFSGSVLYVGLGRFEFVRFLFFVFLFLVAVYFYGQGRGYLRGFDGERMVARSLASVLGDEYSLINDVGFRDGFGNIDHLVVGPNGVFVVETKNYAGRVVCYGDEWLRKPVGAKRDRFGVFGFDVGSPSKQVKRNVGRVRRVIEGIEPFKEGDVWVNGVLVFPNPAVHLEIHDPTVPILKIRELANFVLTRKPNRPLSSGEVMLIGNEILRKARRD